MNYVVGDIQGCYTGLRELLETIEFNPKKDVLWAVGDLIARGDDSLSTIEYLYGLGDSFKTVLGNHDLHFLAIANGLKKTKRSDYLEPLLEHPKCDQWVDWLRRFPLARWIKKDILLVHAGVYPLWSLSKCVDLSKEIEIKLKSDNYVHLLSNMYNSHTIDWQSAKKTPDRDAFIINALTRMRYLNQDMQLNFDKKDAPHHDDELIPWFKAKNKKKKKRQTVVFGHWASLLGHTSDSHLIGLDMGYVWGNKMRCWCVENQQLYEINA